ncbi:MAG: metallophosphoesterase [Proteobacteria bacterium]|nr:metallophosphoesterase [Pseudomonadota bacterium]
MFVLAHLSDPHLAPLPEPTWRQLAGKRALGYVNWRRHRRHRHRRDVLEALAHDLRAQVPDHIAVTGDLVNIALPGEFLAARAWLDRLGRPRDVTLVPGNHDAYVPGALAAMRGHCGDYMRGDDGAAAFPFVRRRGEVALIGLSSAIATSPFMATGALGAAQLGALGDILDELGNSRLARVVLLHHPPAGPRAAHKRLRDAKAFLAVLARHGAELVLHGHDHVPLLTWLAGPRGRVAALGVPSASMAATGAEAPAGYNLYRMARVAGALRCEVIARGRRGEPPAFVEITRRVLAG